MITPETFETVVHLDNMQHFLIFFFFQMCCILSSAGEDVSSGIELHNELAVQTGCRRLGQALYIWLQNYTACWGFAEAIWINAWFFSRDMVITLDLKFVAYATINFPPVWTITIMKRGVKLITSRASSEVKQLKLFCEVSSRLFNQPQFSLMCLCGKRRGFFGSAGSRGLWEANHILAKIIRYERIQWGWRAH